MSMKGSTCCSLPLLFLLLSSLLIKMTSASNHVDLLITWVRENGGFITPGIEFQLLP